MKKSKMVITDLDDAIANLVKKTDHKTLGIWAADCVIRILPYFEEKHPNDPRPRQALEALRRWVQTGVFHMVDIRRDSLGAHAAAKGLADDDSARSAAHAAGQALATAHVSTHSLAAAIYAATAVRDATGSMDAVAKERDWQYQHLIQLQNSH